MIDEIKFLQSWYADNARGFVSIKAAIARMLAECTLGGDAQEGRHATTPNSQWHTDFELRELYRRLWETEREMGLILGWIDLLQRTQVPL